MKILSLSALLLLGSSFLWVRPAAAVERVIVNPAQITTPYGTDSGQLITTGDRMVFVDDANPANSFSIPRSEITNLNVSNGLMTISLTQPFASPLSTGSTVVVRLTNPQSPGEITAWMQVPEGSTVGEASRVAPPPVATQYAYTVRHGDDQGQLVISPVDVRFDSFKHPDHSRAWAYSAIKDFHWDSDHDEIKVKPYNGDTYKFKVEGAQPFTSDVLATVNSRIEANRAH